MSKTVREDIIRIYRSRSKENVIQDDKNNVTLHINLLNGEVKKGH